MCGRVLCCVDAAAKPPHLPLKAGAQPGPPLVRPPQANTSGCTKQAQGFRARYQEIKDAGFEVYGLSFDNPTAQTKWKTKLDLPYSLLTDDNGEVGVGTHALAFRGRTPPCAGADREHQHVLRRPTAAQFLKAMGAFRPPRRVIRSHVVAVKGGKILSSVIKISPEPSVKSAIQTALDNKQ